MAIVEQSLAVARDQLEQTRALIGVGKVAEVELAAAEAEVALRNGSVIDARANRDTTRLHLLRLLDLPGEKPFEREVRLADSPVAPAGAPEPLALHVALALNCGPTSTRRACNRTVAISNWSRPATASCPSSTSSSAWAAAATPPPSAVRSPATPAAAGTPRLARASPTPSATAPPTPPTSTPSSA